MIHLSPTLICALITLSVIIGIWLQSLYAFSFITPLSILIIGILFASIVHIFYRRHRFVILSCVLIGSCAFGSIIYWYQWRTFNHFWSTLRPISYKVYGSVVAVDNVEHLFTKQRLTLHLTRIYDTQWHTCNGSVYVYTNKTNFRVADTIELEVVQLKKPTDNNFIRYLLRDGIYGTTFSNNLTYTLKHRPSFSCVRAIAEWRDHIFTQLRTKMSRNTFSLFSALFLGNRSFNKKQTDPINLLFKRWGIAHVYARSGLHLALLIWVWFIIMRLFPISHTIKIGLLLCIGSLYALLSWSSISFLRALILFLLCYVCRLVYIPYRTIHLLIITCLVTLLYNPFHLFFLDFQLSFALTFALCILQII